MSHLRVGAFLIGLLLGGIALAQITGGSFTGLVTDSTGAVIAQAAVEARNVATNVSSRTLTTEAGYYEFPLLPAGRYVITVEKQGFQRSITGELALNSGTRPRIDITLRVGDLSQSVEVVASAPLVNATSQALGTVVDSQKVMDLPLNGRSFTQLLILQPGVSMSGGNAGRGGVELNGSAGLGNNWLMDGVDMSFGENNGVGLGGVGGSGTVITTISVEALEEFKTTTNAYSAEYGRATGGVIALTTKSGTNQYHGTALYFLRNDKLDANNFFSNRSNLGKPPLRHNQFGGNFGGPIIRDKLFFFYNYEGAIVRRGRTISGTVPTPLFLNQVTNPTLRTHLEGLPRTFEPTSNPLIGQHFRNDRQKDNEHTHLWRGDYLLGGHRISGRYAWDYQDVLNPEIRVDLYRAFPLRQKNLMFSDFWASSHFSNEMRFGMNRVSVVRAPADGRQKPGNPLGGGYASIPGISGTDVQDQLGTFTTTWSGLDNFSYIRGAHTMKMGVEVRTLDSRREQFGSARVFYNSIQDAIVDNPFQVEMYFGNPSGGYTTNNYAWYFQDDWKVTRRLQLNLGMRYEYFTPLAGSIGLATRDPFGARTKKGDPLWDPDKNNFAPRLGIVYDPFGTGKTVIRAGGGITYGAPQPFFFYDAAWLDARVPFAPLVSIVDLPASVKPVTFPFPESFIVGVRNNPSLAPQGLQPGLLAPDRGRRDEYAIQSNVSLQQQLSDTIALQISYVFNRALKMYTSRLLNPLNPATGRRDIGQDIGAAWLQENGARMWYHGLQVALDKRLSKGLTFNIYYTFSRGMQYHNADNSFVRDSITQDFTNIAGSVGPKATDVRHRFQLVHSYAIPTGSWGQSNAVGRFLLDGWTVQSIMGWRSGFPLNIITGRDNIGNGRPDGQRPDRVADVDQTIDSADRLLRFNRAAYDTTALARERRYGNLGYNTARGLSAFTWDAALHKIFRITERQRITFRFEAFNWLNHTALGNPSSSLADANFGRITGVAVDPRNIQFGLKYAF